MTIKQMILIKLMFEYIDEIPSKHWETKWKLMQATLDIGNSLLEDNKSLTSVANKSIKKGEKKNEKN